MSESRHSHPENQHSGAGEFLTIAKAIGIELY